MSMAFAITGIFLVSLNILLIEAGDRNCTTRYGSPGWKCGSYEESARNNEGNCIPTWMVCNGSPDCGRRRSVGKQLDKSLDDDEGATCQVECETDPSRKTQAEFSAGDCSTCMSQLWWRCKTGICIRKTQLCDGISDCSDDSDESIEQCRVPCTPDPSVQEHPTHPGGDCRKCGSQLAWRCDDGRCVDKGVLCDGKRDCSRGEDEGAVCQLVTCESDPEVKTATMFAHGDCRRCFGGTRWRCDSGACISKRGLCDGVKNCRDGEDESDWICNSGINITRITQPQARKGEANRKSIGPIIIVIILNLLL